MAPVDENGIDRATGMKVKKSRAQEALDIQNSLGQVNPYVQTPTPTPTPDTDQWIKKAFGGMIGAAGSAIGRPRTSPVRRPMSAGVAGAAGALGSAIRRRMNKGGKVK